MSKTLSHYLLFLLVVICTTTIVSANLFDYYEYDNDDDMIIGDDVYIDMPSFSNPRDALRYYFGNDDADEENYQLLQDLRKSTLFNPNIAIQRQSKSQMLFGMEYDEYAEVAEYYRTDLVNVAFDLGIEYNQFTTTYSELLEEAFMTINKYHNQMSEEDYEVMALRLTDLLDGQELFLNNYTMLPIDVEDIVLQGVINLDKMINWLSNHLLSNKCTWCKKLAAYIRGKACDTGAKAVCKVIAVAATAEFSPLVIKYGCGAPVNLNKHLSNLCQKGVTWLQGKGKIGDADLCKKISFGSINIPNHNGLIFKCSAKRIVIGSLC